MERARATWTDERLDDLGRRVESGFDRLDHDFRALSARLDTQVGELSRRIDAQGAELSARIDAQGAELSGRIDALQRTMIQIGAVTGGGIFATLASVIITRG
jgi:hypothetical protein